MKWYLYCSIYALVCMPALGGMAYPTYPDGALYIRLKNALHKHDVLTVNFLIEQDQKSIVELFLEPKNYLLSYIVRLAYQQSDLHIHPDINERAAHTLSALVPLFTDPDLRERTVMNLSACLGEPVLQWLDTINY